MAVIVPESLARVRLTHVLVYGGRDYANVDRVFEVLDGLRDELGPLLVVEGCARGADSLAEAWAHSRDQGLWHFPAEWDKHGRGAGPIRNQRMLDDGAPELGVGFPGGRGTADMTRRLEAAGVEVRRVDW